MKFRILVFVSVVTGIVALLGAYIHASRESGADKIQGKAGPRTALCCPAQPVAPGVFTDRSLYQIDSTWTNDVGRAVKLSEFAGQVQVVAMFFANCQMACPLLVDGVKRIEAALPEDLRSHVRFVLITFDTERDNSQALHAYRVHQGLSTNRWTILRGNADDTLELAALLGVRYKKDLRGDFAHSNVITVLNSAGEIAFQQIGLNQDIEAGVVAIKKAAAEAKPAL